MHTSRPPLIAPPLIDRRTEPSERIVASPVRLLSRRRRTVNRSWLDFVRLQRNRVESLKDTPPWLLSLIFHLVFMLLLALITFKSTIGNSLRLTFQQGEGVVGDSIAEFSLQPVELEAQSGDDALAHIYQLQEINMSVPNLLPMPKRELSPAQDAKRMDAVSGMQSQTVGLSSSTTMFSGRTGAMKQSLLNSGGGTKETEDAVALGLAWLKRQQAPDGSWSMLGPYASGSRSENPVAATSMAMLAFMGAGHTHHAGDYQAELNKAVKWLIKQQDSHGFMAHQARDNEKMYAQAQATIALCELYAMTKDYRLQPYAQKACNFACRSQSPQGGWRYVPRFDSDTSVTGWFVMGLKSGLAAGLDIGTGVFPKVTAYLDSVGSEYNSGYAYQVGKRPSPSMTAEAMLCRQYLGWHRNIPGMAQGLGALVKNHPLDIDQSDVYYWYYATQTLHHYGGPLWEEWNDRLKVDVPTNQVKQGVERGSWAPGRDAWGAHAGRLYTTCLSIYCLEVYYRHLPLYDATAESVAASL